MKATCKPGGCSSLGCEGGYYCFTADGTPKIMTEEKREELRTALAGIVSQDEQPSAQTAAQALYDRLSDPHARIRPGATTAEIQQQINNDIKKEMMRCAGKRSTQDAISDWLTQHANKLLVVGSLVMVAVLVVAPTVYYIASH